jgi:hypothetical protein
MTTYSAVQKLACIERELRFRRRVYKHWIDSGKFTENAAKQEIEVMEAIAADYRAQIDAANLKLDF